MIGKVILVLKLLYNLKSLYVGVPDMLIGNNDFLVCFLR